MCIGIHIGLLVTIMNKGFIAILLIYLFSACNLVVENRIETEILSDTLEKGKIRITEYKKVYKAESDTLLCIITSVNNKDDDLKTFYLTGISAKDGLKKWLVDSFFYNVDNFDTIKL